MTVVTAALTALEFQGLAAVSLEADRRDRAILSMLLYQWTAELVTDYLEAKQGEVLIKKPHLA